MKRRARVIIPVALLIALIAFRLVQKRVELHAQLAQRAAALKAPPVVAVAPVRVQDLTTSYEGVASVEAPLSVKIAPRVTGQIDFLEVHEGDHISAGQVLVRIDPAEVEAQVRQAQGAVKEAEFRLAQAQTTQRATDVSVASQLGEGQAAVESAQANLTNAQAHYERQHELYRQGFIAAQDVEDARTAVGVQKAAVDAARAALEFARANLAQQPAYQQNLAALRAAVDEAKQSLKAAEARRGYTTLHAPFDGFVTGRFMDPGSVPLPGQAVLAVQYMREVWVTVAVPADVIGGITVGHLAAVTLDALPGRTLTGRIIQFNPSADPQSRQFSVRVGLDNPEMVIKPGMFAHVVIETGRVPGATVVPREAAQHDANGDYVMVIDESKVAHRRPVTLGQAGVDVIAISEGVRPGETVVTLSASPLKEGQAVTISSEKPAAPPAGGRAPARRY